jgi:hypothetical protein
MLAVPRRLNPSILAIPKRPEDPLRRPRKRPLQTDQPPLLLTLTPPRPPSATNARTFCLLNRVLALLGLPAGDPLELSPASDLAHCEGADGCVEDCLPPPSMTYSDSQDRILGPPQVAPGSLMDSFFAFMKAKNHDNFERGDLSLFCPEICAGRGREASFHREQLRCDALLPLCS